MLNCLTQALSLVRLIVEATVENPVYKAGIIKLDSALVALCPILDRSDHGFVQSVSLGNIVVVSTLKRVSLRR